MYKIRFTNSEGAVITKTISNNNDLKKIRTGDAKESVILAQIGSDMPIELHNAIAKHNSKVEEKCN